MGNGSDDPRASRILDIIAKETFVDRSKLLPEAGIDELGIASIDIVQTVFAIESEFDIELPIAGAGGGAEFATVKELVDHVLATLDQADALKLVPPSELDESVKRVGEA